MNRYGGRLSSIETSDTEYGNEHDRYEQVMYGGCGVRFGSFTRRAEIQKSRPAFDLFSFLGLRRKQPKEET
jgi:hypothetical protein